MLTQTRELDRFIPNRNYQQLDFSIKKDESVYGNFLKHNICPTSRVLNFSNKQNHHHNVIKRSQSNTKSNLSVSKDCFQNQWCFDSRRNYKKLRSCHDAEKILDVPCIRDDFYLNNLDWSPLGPLAIGLDNQAYVYTPSNVFQVCKLLDGTYISSLKFYDTTLTIGYSDGKIRIYDIETNSIIRQISEHSKRVSALSFCSRNILYSGSKDKNILVNDVRIKDATINRLNAHKGQICALQCQPQVQNYLASGSNDNNVAIWDIRTHRLFKKYTQHKGAVKAISWCPWKSGVIATAGGAGDKMIRLWNVSDNEDLACRKTDSQISSLLWSCQTGLLISSHGYPENFLNFWKPQLVANKSVSLQKVKQLKGHTGRILDLAMSPGENMVGSVSADETLRFWRLTDCDHDAWTRQQSRVNRWSIKLK